MSQDLTLYSPTVVIPSISPDTVHTYLENARARSTIRSYHSSFHQFQAWCTTAGLLALPASGETVALYLSARASCLRAATLDHHLAAITKAHKAAGLASPIQDNLLVKETLKGIKRVHGTASQQKAPVLTEDLRAMLRFVANTLQGIRDAAVLLLGFAGAFRRSELVALNVADIQFEPEGVLLKLRRSKTDPEGEGRLVAVPYGVHAETCPVQALQKWLELAGITDGPLFRSLRKRGTVTSKRLSGHAVAAIVKKYAQRADFVVSEFSGHSLRAGFVTSAARAGQPEHRIMRQTGHKSTDMVLRYIRVANAFSENAAQALGL